MIIFAEYRGPDFGDGNFIKGKIYLAEVVTDHGAEYSTYITIVDEDGESIRLEREDNRFFCSKGVDVVVVDPMPGSNIEEGSIIRCYGASREDDGIKVDIGEKGGYWNLSRIVFLDRTILQLGVKVLSDSKWGQITGVSDKMSVLVGGKWISPPHYCFFVNRGQIRDIPLVECISSIGADSIDLGQLYEVSGQQGDLYSLEGIPDENFDKERFKKV
jgi:hypothetical protein